jgi:Fe-S-cluster containining protein
MARPRKVSPRNNGRKGQVVSEVGSPDGDVWTWDLMDWPVKRARDRNGHGDCMTCKGRCCSYVTVEIDKPTDKVDRDEIRWFLAHENIQVFLEDGDWYVQFYTRCKHLTAEGMCGIYEDRFDVCREHGTDECEMSDGPTDAVIFTETEEFDRWWAERKRKKKEKKAAKKRQKNNGKKVSP